MNKYTQGICEDGAAILKDGLPLTIEEILSGLRHSDQLTAINQELVEALSGLINDIDMNHHIHTDNMIGGSTREALTMAEVAIKRAKELTNEG